MSIIISDHLSLKVSLQWLFEHDPALEDADVIARVNLVDPDGVPGSGDEFFETVESGGTESCSVRRRLGRTRWIQS